MCTITRLKDCDIIASMERVFSPSVSDNRISWGVAPGWYGAAPSALIIDEAQTGRFANVEPSALVVGRTHIWVVS